MKTTPAHEADEKEKFLSKMSKFLMISFEKIFKISSESDILMRISHFQTKIFFINSNEIMRNFDILQRISHQPHENTRKGGDQANNIKIIYKNKYIFVCFSNLLFIVREDIL